MNNARGIVRLFHQAQQHLHITLLVAGLFDRGFGDEGGVDEAGVVEQAAEGFEAHGSLADVFMAVEFGAARGLGVVHVPDADSFEADGCGGLFDGLLIALGGDQIVTGDMGVAGVETDGDRGRRLEPGDEFGYLLEAAAERELRSGSVFNEDVEGSLLPGQAVDGFGDGFGSQLEAFVAR